MGIVSNPAELDTGRMVSMSVDDDPELDEAQRLEVLDHSACIELLAHHRFVGRLALIVDGRPIILPVNYIFDHNSVVFCTASGTKLDAVTGGADVAFEVDDSSPLHHSGWSVLVRGHAEVITDPGELTRLRHGPLRPWAKGARANWVRITLEEISGRRIPDI
jgi:nitroimidazol reductase NimA-like FMN-containing flavoprotein (pyridoxamine 5'-phosphate oxidase superfamily)